eukprot:8390530-Ditylum_brightwellii.AAC.1
MALLCGTKRPRPFMTSGKVSRRKEWCSSCGTLHIMCRTCLIWSVFWGLVREERRVFVLVWRSARNSSRVAEKKECEPFGMPKMDESGKDSIEGASLCKTLELEEFFESTVFFMNEDFVGLFVEAVK